MNLLLAIWSIQDFQERRISEAYLLLVLPILLADRLVFCPVGWFDLGITGFYFITVFFLNRKYNVSMMGKGDLTCIGLILLGIGLKGCVAVLMFALALIGILGLMRKAIRNISIKKKLPLIPALTLGAYLIQL